VDETLNRSCAVGIERVVGRRVWAEKRRDVDGIAGQSLRLNIGDRGYAVGGVWKRECGTVCGL
jgi:hypothetical protein